MRTMYDRRRPHYLPAFLVIVIMTMLIAVYIIVFYMINKPDQIRIIQGVFVENIDIGGLRLRQG